MQTKKKLFSKNSFFLLAIKQRIGMITVILCLLQENWATSVFQIHDLTTCRIGSPFQLPNSRCLLVSFSGLRCV